MYSARLLNMLENCDTLQYPFNERPPNEALKSFDEIEPVKTARSHLETSRSHHNNSIHVDTQRNLAMLKPDLDIFTFKHDYTPDLNLETCQFLNQFNQHSFLSKIQEEKSQKSNVSKNMNFFC